MTETSATHHKIKAEWTKASKNEHYSNSSSESDKLQIVERSSPVQKIEILEQIVIYPNQKSSKCHYCDKNFDSSFLDEHQKIHDKNFFHCDICDKKFKRKSGLRKHSYLHKGRFKYECGECKVTFIDLTKYELHKNTKHRTKESRQFHCQEPNCSKSFASAEYLKRHQVTHSDDCKYKCATCDQKFKWMTSLQIHQTIHTQNKTLVKCSKCFKRFFNQRTLERHQKIHKSLKFRCTLCEKVVSNRKDNIRRHIKHLHADVEKSDIASKIVTFEDHQEMEVGDEIDNDDSSTSEPVVTSLHNSGIQKVSPSEEIPKVPSALPVINNRVNVIKSIGNPNKHQQPAVPAEVDPPATKLPQKSQEFNFEIKLPPKKKAIVNSQPNSSAVLSVPASKPKYDPIQHYRKMLLGFSKDDDHPTTSEEIVEEDESGQEPQVFPVHWRKRTSQNFLFRR